MEYEGTMALDNEHACSHFWILARDNFGVCNKCGARKFFPSTWTSYSRSKKKIDVVPHHAVLEQTKDSNK